MRKAKIILLNAFIFSILIVIIGCKKSQNDNPQADSNKEFTAKTFTSQINSEGIIYEALPFVFN